MVETLYKNAVEILTSQGKFHINLGLERVQEILKLLGNPEKNLKFIHVAGTNGKGSVCAILSSILAQSGLKTGLFTSPHVFEYTERIKINNTEIDKETFANELINVVDLAERNSIHLTEFEILTVLAFIIFAQNNVEIVVLETGLGGRLDATNVIEKNICSIITHIALDHTERLGDTIEKIAFEKAGIIKNNCPVIMGSKNLGANVIKQVANDKNAPTYFADDKAIDENLSDALSLKGSYQKENLALALKAIEVLKTAGFKITEKDVLKGLSNVTHHCRFEYLKDQNILIDGAHNPNGIIALRESLDKNFANKKIKFIFGCLRNKDYKVMMKNLFRPEDEIYFYHFGNPNSCEYDELAEKCEYQSKPFFEYKKDATLTVICGSFYMIKELLTKMGIK